MKKTLTHHQFYSLCCAIEDNPEAQSMSDADLVIHINDAIGLAVTPDQIRRAFESLGMIRLSEAENLECAVRGLCVKIGFSFGELVSIGRKSLKAQRDALEKLSKTSEKELPLEGQE
jgi:hypothetical protein